MYKILIYNIIIFFVQISFFKHMSPINLVYNVPRHRNTISRPGLLWYTFFVLLWCYLYRLCLCAVLLFSIEVSHKKNFLGACAAPLPKYFCKECCLHFYSEFSFWWSWEKFLAGVSTRRVLGFLKIHLFLPDKTLYNLNNSSDFPFAKKLNYIL